MYVPDAAIANLNNVEGLKTAAQLLGSGLLASVYAGAAMDIAYSDMRNGVGAYRNTTKNSSANISGYNNSYGYQFMLRGDNSGNALFKIQSGFLVYAGSYN